MVVGPTTPLSRRHSPSTGRLLAIVIPVPVIILLSANFGTVYAAAAGLAVYVGHVSLTRGLVHVRGQFITDLIPAALSSISPTVNKGFADCLSDGIG